MESLECILCFIKIQKKGDVNLVQKKRDFDASAEIKSLHFVVRPIFTKIHVESARRLLKCLIGSLAVSSRIKRTCCKIKIENQQTQEQSCQLTY